MSADRAFIFFLVASGIAAALGIASEARSQNDKAVIQDLLRQLEEKHQITETVAHGA